MTSLKHVDIWVLPSFRFEAGVIVYYHSSPAPLLCRVSLYPLMYRKYECRYCYSPYVVVLSLFLCDDKFLACSCRSLLALLAIVVVVL